MSHVLLIGFMGAGKTTVSRMVAEELGRPAVDLERAIEAAAGRRVHEIFKDAGENVFRELESEQLAALAEVEPSVVACGGAIVVRDENRSVLKRLGLVVYLRVSAGETIARVSARNLPSGPGGRPVAGFPALTVLLVRDVVRVARGRAQRADALRWVPPAVRSAVIAATRLLEARESLYAAIADITIDTVGRSAEDVAAEIVAAVRERAARADLEGSGSMSKAAPMT